MESTMAKDQVLHAYKQTDQIYVNGIETPHGRIKILYETIVDNVDNLSYAHPKTDFVSFGKCLNSLSILTASLDMKAGGDLAVNLSNLYSYCSNQIKEYLETKSETNLLEVKDIISGLLDAWEQIDSTGR